MAAHLTRDGGGSPPPGRNEVLLRGAVDRLRGELAATREESQEHKEAAAAMAELATRREVELRGARKVVEATREVGHGPMALHWNPQCVQCQAIAAYDKAMGGT